MACGRLRPGDRVRMTEALRARLRGRCAGGVHVDGPNPPIDGRCMNCSTGHLEEFGACVGVVQGPVDYNDVPRGDARWDPAKLGPEVDVRWQPSNLRYMYAEDDLELVPPAAPEV